MKAKDIRELGVDEIASKLAEARNTYQDLKITHKVSPIENPIQVRNARKTVARLATILSQVKQQQQ